MPPNLPPPDWPPSAGSLPNLPSPSTPSTLFDHGLQVYLPTRSITAAKCISEFTRSWPPSASPNSINHSLLVHLWVHSISVSKCITNHARSRPPSTSSGIDGKCLEIQQWRRRTQWRGVYVWQTAEYIQIVSFLSHHFIQWQYKLYVSQHLASFALSEISWILNAGWYHIFSPNSYARRTRTALCRAFHLEAPRVCPDTPSIMLKYHLWLDWLYVYI